jgi:hypothetical protein
MIARIAAEPMPAEEWQAAERLLARLIARAYTADHPELFGPRLSEVLEKVKPGPPAAAAAVAGAPPASAGGPEEWSMEPNHGTHLAGRQKDADTATSA